MRADRAADQLAPRVLSALRSGDMDTIALAGRLRANPNNVVRLLKQLEARGVVRCVEMRRGPVASEWTLVREQERRAS